MSRSPGRRPLRALLARGSPLVAALSLAAACERPLATPAEPAPPAKSVPPASAIVPAPPTGRLPAGVSPEAYALELRIDPTQETFTGKTSIELRIDRPTRGFWMHGKGLTVTRATLASPARPEGAVTVDEVKGQGLLWIDLGGEVGPGSARLTIEYGASFGEGLAGLYRVRVDGRWYAFSQFEALDARRAFPCFDEPSFKRPFDVTLIAPAGLQAIGNTREVASAPDAAAGFTRHTFARSERLPTYLLAFAVGDLDVVETAPIPPSAIRPAPIPLRGAAVKGKGPQLAFALSETTQLVRELETYFGIPYPYDKLDILAVPDFAAGAMENAGAVTYRENLLLIDPATATETQRRDVVSVSAHELAHQWFGDLVTMAWWDDVWLNEAFATWMGQRTVAALHPAWNADLELQGEVLRAMETDSLASARKIRQPILSEDDVESAFDDLTYLKGAGVIGMFERFSGEPKFRAGVQRYLRAFRFGSATTDDFMATVFDEGDAALRSAFRGYLERPGVPRVEVATTCAAGKLTGLTVQAERFLPLGSPATKQMAFQLPLCLRQVDGSSCQMVATTPGEKVPLRFPIGSPCPPFTFANAGGTGYLRVTSSSAQIRSLFDTAYVSLSPPERIAAVDALRASFRSGTAEVADVLGALRKVTSDPMREVAMSGNDLLAFVSSQLVRDEDRSAYQKLVASMFKARQREVGFRESPSDGADRRLLRRDLVDLMALGARDPELRKEALAAAKRVLGMGGDGQLHPGEVASDVMTTVLTVGVQDGGAEVWDVMLAQLHASRDAALRGRFLTALASATDAKLAQRARELIFDPKLKQQEALSLVFHLLQVREQRVETWDWFRANLGRIVDRLPDSYRSYLIGAAEPLCDAGRAAEVRAAFEPLLGKIQGAKLALDNGAERLAICEAIRRRHQAGAAAYFAKAR